MRRLPFDRPRDGSAKRLATYLRLDRMLSDNPRKHVHVLRRLKRPEFRSARLAAFLKQERHS